MLGSLDALIIGMIAFVGGHFALASLPIRQPIAEKIGENGFRGVYSLLMLAALVWTIKAYGAAPYIEVWSPPLWSARVPNVVMPFACILLVTSVTTRNPTGMGGESILAEPRPLRGIMTVTRHPMLWGFGLWGLSHLSTNGDAASMLLFGGIAVLSFLGMPAIDGKMAAKLKRDGQEGNWGPVALTTSIIPFQAALEGRTTIDWSGIGLWRVGLGLAIWAALYGTHSLYAGVWPHPVM